MMNQLCNESREIVENNFFIEHFITDLTNAFNGARFDTPEAARAKCLVVSQLAMIRNQDCHNIKVGYAELALRPEAWEENSFCTNHYAPVINGNIVVDFTLRQFFPEASYPAVMHYDEWIRTLEQAWAGYEVDHKIGSQICHTCYTGVVGLCDCE